jgi:peptidoglycan/xylan/chitin deacetylase (PgdA/CDA1 family)
MIVKSTVSSLWLADPLVLAAGADRLDAILVGAPARTDVFFRADDVAVPSDPCRRMLGLFRRHGVPLHLAVTPAWLTEARWAILKEWAGSDDLWCWHQHGWRHVNHQRRGKKGEFGDDRDREDKAADLASGRARLQAIMGESFSPVFTPPWNRFDAETADLLLGAGYVAVSRSDGAQRKVPLPSLLPDIPVNVDLHTRREADPAEGLDALLHEFEAGVRSGRVGVMLHHQRMNDAAFVFLDRCLAAVAGSGLRRIRIDRL